MSTKQIMHKPVPILGYRELSQGQIDLMNEIKSMGIELEALVTKLRNANFLETDPPDPRWVSVGATHLQQGLMALTRSVARPTFF